MIWYDFIVFEELATIKKRIVDERWDCIILYWSFLKHYHYTKP